MFLRKLVFLVNTVVASLFACWFAGLVLFLARVPDLPALPPEKADAIVILTGGSLRVREGVELLAHHTADKLFISGVGEKVARQDILKQIPGLIADEDAERITLGHQAQSTRGNAEETEQWVRSNKVRSIILVTAHYHLPRAMLEFKERMPTLKIYPYPVFPAAQQERPKDYYLLIIKEYHKFLYRWWGVPVELQEKVMTKASL